MTSRFEVTDLEEEAREQRSQDAFDQFIKWATGRGKQPMTIPLRAREAALIVAVLAHHAAEVTKQGGDPNILIDIACHVSQQLEGVLGRREAGRIIKMCGTMMTGLE